MLVRRIGRRVKKRRKSKGLTLLEVARRIGCHESTLSRFERGLHFPSVQILRGLERVLGFAAGFLLFRIQATRSTTDAVVHEPREISRQD